jgi:hypothetical protein
MKRVESWGTVGRQVPPGLSITLQLAQATSLINQMLRAGGSGDRRLRVEALVCHLYHQSKNANNEKHRVTGNQRGAQILPRFGRVFRTSGSVPKVFASAGINIGPRIGYGCRAIN